MTRAWRPPRPMRLAIVNVISALRLPFAALFPLAGAEARLVILLLGALSDWLDGVLARRWDARSLAGNILDAAGDKLLALMVLLTLVAETTLAWWWLPLLLARDVGMAVLLLASLWRRGRRGLTQIEHRWSGKIATALIFMALVSVLALPRQETMNLALLGLAAACSVAAGLHNVARAQSRMKAPRQLA